MENLEIVKDKKTIDGKYTKEQRREYMKKYYKDNDKSIVCDICGGKYKSLTGKRYHDKTKKHLASKIVYKNELLKKDDDNVRDKILKKLCDEVEELKLLLNEKTKQNDDINTFLPSNDNNV
jgi:hypothetical protein